MLFPYLIKVSLLLAALTLGYRWLIQFETFSKVNRALLWLNVAAAWALPLIPLAQWGPVEVQQEFHQSLPALIKVSPQPIEKLTIDVATSPTIVQNTSLWSISDWLLLIYLTGVLLIAGRFLIQLGGLFRSLQKAPSEPLERGIRLVRNTSTTSPYSFFHWIVCNPDNHTAHDLQQILAHESEHVRQWHSADLLLAELQRIALWFNPFAWVHQRLAQGNLEYLADRAVLADGYEKKQYQLNLLKTALQTNELPLTNSFAQSLLKKRIKMMNRKPSRYWVWGKYALLLGGLYLSSAFVAPYRQKLVEIAPEVVRPLVSALVEEPHTVKGEATPKIESTLEEADQQVPVLLKEQENDTVKDQPKKWVLVKGDTLFWAVPARATLGTLSSIQEEIRNFGSEMTINFLKYDLLQNYLTSLFIKIKTQNSSGSIGDENSAYTPVEGFSGYIIKSGNLGMGQLPPDPLYSQLRNEYSAALDLKQKNQNTYIEDSLRQLIPKNTLKTTSITYLKKHLEGSYAETILQGSGIGKSEHNTLLLTEIAKEADFMLNNAPSTFEELNQLSFDQLGKVTILWIPDRKKIIRVFTR